jgi:hypothetical protein
MMITAFVSLACNIFNLIILGHLPCMPHKEENFMDSVTSVYKPHGGHTCSHHHHGHGHGHSHGEGGCSGHHHGHEHHKHGHGNKAHVHSHKEEHGHKHDNESQLSHSHIEPTTVNNSGLSSVVSRSTASIQPEPNNKLMNGLGPWKGSADVED